MSGLAAVLPAGGKSRRMGRFKPLLPLGDGCVLERAVRTFKKAGIERIVVVTGNRAEEVAAKARAAGAEVAHNPDFEQGMFTSIRAGVDWLGDDNADHFFILPADTPLVRPETVRLHGFHAAAEIVAVHPDLKLAPDAPLTEREIVFLADKYVQGEELVPLEARYQAKLTRFGADKEAAQAIQGRLARAQAVRERVEAAAGIALEQLLEVKP